LLAYSRNRRLIMAMTPVEVRHQQLKRGLFGYRRRGVDDLMTDIADSFEVVWRERADLVDRVEELEADLARHVELEGLLRSTLISAERAAQDQRERARREADTILGEAHAEARTVTRESRAEKERLDGEARRITSLLRSALAVVEDTGSEEQVAAPTVDEPPTAEPETPPASGDRPEIRRIAG
jgi:cell division initiation protein